MESDWKAQMFEEHADLFIRVLDAKPVGADFADFVRHVAGPAATRGRVLDLGCGAGRLFPHLRGIAASVTAVDLSPDLLAVAERRAAALGEPPIRCVRADMREVDAAIPGAPFDLILRAYTSLGYFPREAELDILRRCLAIANPGGVVLLDTFNRDWLARNASIRRTIPINGGELEESYDLYVAARLLRCRWRYRTAAASVPIDFALEAYGVEDVHRLLESAGWAVVGCWADYRVAPPIAAGSVSERIIAVGRRP